MTTFRLFSVVLFAFGAVAFGAVAACVIPTLRERRFNLAAASDVLLLLACCGWFAVNALLELGPLRPDLDLWALWALFLFICFLFPPLIVVNTLGDVDPENGPRIPFWMRPLLALMFLAAPTVLGLYLGYVRGWETLEWREVGPWVTAAIPVMYITAATLSIVIVRRSKKPRETRRDRLGRWGHIFVLGLMIVVFVPMILQLAGQVSNSELLSVFSRSLPLAFLVAFSYNEGRFQFFDFLIKNGASMLLALTLFGASFALVLPLLAPAPKGWWTPWAYALLFLPTALAWPPLSRRLSRFLDHVWLGRRFLPHEALSHFVDGTRDALSESELVALAERRLGKIFQAPATIDLGLREAGEPEFEVEVPVGRATEPSGAIRMGRRANDMPWFREDVALLESLSGVFSSLLDNVRSQARRREQDQLVQEMSLRASRAELTALRAQINPHFLFNALNAIAGLIHQNPLRADRAIERLAEVFRYTLRSSDTEWTPLSQELEFARAYLDVEQARFGKRLEVSIRAEEGVGSYLVPAMMLQTLVENAIKHGVATVRGVGHVGIEAASTGKRLTVEVADNGPGFARDEAGADDDGGHGLSNVRRRLAGHYGDEASLRVRRDDGAERTRVTIDLPLERLSRAGAEGDRRDSRGAVP